MTAWRSALPAIQDITLNSKLLLLLSFSQSLNRSISPLCFLYSQFHNFTTSHVTYHISHISLLNTFSFFLFTCLPVSWFLVLVSWFLPISQYSSLFPFTFLLFTCPYPLSFDLYPLSFIPCPSTCSQTTSHPPL